MKRLVLYPYKVYSASAKEIQKVLGGIRVLPNGTYVRKKNDLVINWGSSSNPKWLDDRPILNPPDKTRVATNKLSCFQALKDKVPIPTFTTDRNEAINWNTLVVCRHKLTANSGNGIELWSPESETPIPNAPLYVMYKKKRKEFRVHVFKEKVIRVIEKRRRNLENRPANFSNFIRSHLNGWVFCINDIVEPEDLRPVAIEAVKELGLDFGAVDIIWNEHENKCYVLEINTAPGIEGTTLNDYCEEIKECLK